MMNSDPQKTNVKPTPPFEPETMARLEGLVLVLKSINARMKREGFRIEDGQLVNTDYPCPRQKKHNLKNSKI